jgi:Cu+-exporting ATPase
MANEQIDVKVGKMKCPNCVAAVEEALSNVDGVNTFEVSLDDANAKIEYDSDKASKDDMKKAIEDAGFEYLGEN